MPTLRTGDGRTLAWSEVGTGPEVLCHPGGPGASAASFGGLSTYDGERFHAVATRGLSPELVGFGQTAYRRRSAKTSLVMGQLFERFQAEGFAMSFTMQDFLRDFWAEHAGKLTPDRSITVAKVWRNMWGRWAWQCRGRRTLISLVRRPRRRLVRAACAG